VLLGELYSFYAFTFIFDGLFTSARPITPQILSYCILYFCQASAASATDFAHFRIPGLCQMFRICRRSCSNW